MTPLTAYRPGDMAARAARASVARPKRRPKKAAVAAPQASLPLAAQPRLRWLPVQPSSPKSLIPPPPPTPAPDRGSAALNDLSREVSARNGPAEPWPSLTPAETWLKGWQTFWLHLMGGR